MGRVAERGSYRGGRGCKSGRRCSNNQFDRLVFGLTNLLPEGVRLFALKDRTKTSLEDELTLLLAVGHDCVGNVAVVPEGEDPDLLPVEPLPYDVDDLFARAQAAEDPTGLSGVQEKISSAMLEVPDYRFDGRPAIIKFVPRGSHSSLRTSISLCAWPRRAGYVPHQLGSYRTIKAGSHCGWSGSTGSKSMGFGRG